MPFPMVHMVVAYNLLTTIDWIERPEDFILGSVAPDSVHFAPEYNVKLKERSHLWDCGPRWGETTDSNRWRENVLNFWMLHKNDVNRDFIAGYCTHILTDWLNDLRIWSPFKRKFGAGISLEEFHKIYSKEAKGIDQWLYLNYMNKLDIINMLLSGVSYTIEGLCEKEHIETQKQCIVEKDYIKVTTIDISEYSYYTVSSTDLFINECIEVISNELHLAF